MNESKDADRGSRALLCSSFLQELIMVVRSDVGVWMHDESRCESVARMVAVDCMMALGLDHVNDFRTRDKIVVAISDRINRVLSEVADEDA